MGGLFVILVNIVKLSFIITTVSSIEICSNVTQTGREVILDKVYNSGGSCGCSVKLVGGEENSLVTFQSNQVPRGCQYKLMFNLKTVTREYNCSNYTAPYQFNMTPTDNLYVYLINDRDSTGDFVFNLNIQPETNGSQVNLSCRSPWTNPLVTTETTTNQTSPTQISTNQTTASKTSPSQPPTTETPTTQTSPTQTLETQTPATRTSPAQILETQTPATQTSTTKTSTTQTPTRQTPTTQTPTTQTLAISSIEICSNETQGGREVILNKVYNSGGSCGCSVKLVGGEENSLVTFHSTWNPAGCQYKLMFNLKTVTREYSCFNFKTPYQFTMTPTDILYVYLMNDRDNTSGFVFNLTVQSETNDQRVVLACSSLWTNLLVTSDNIHYTSTTGTSGESESTKTTDRSKTTEKSQNSNLPVIVGCTVSGVVLVCVVVVIVICFLKRRKQKGQTDQNLSDQNLTDENLYSNNIYDNSSPTQHQNTVDRNSYSDCYDHIPNDSLQIRNKNQVVMMSNNNTDSLDNDDNSKYGETASEHYERVPDQLEQVPDQLEHVPEPSDRVPNTDVEYAVVQKKPKKKASQDKAMKLNNSRNKRIVHDDYENVPKDNLNLKREINRIVGPKGDDYTLVNKC